MSKNLFVVGTGTDVGKTYVTALIVKKLHDHGKNAAYFKAAMSGNARKDGRLLPGDARFVRQVSGIEQPCEEMCPYVYEAAVSPHLAARMENNPVEMKRVLEKFDGVCRKYGFVTAEGAGGIVCPLRYDGQTILLEDFIKARSLGCLLVADAGLGTINAAVLTAEYIRVRGIRVKGIVLNRYRAESPMHEDNARMCEALTGLKVLARVKEGERGLDMPFSLLESLYE